MLLYMRRLVGLALIGAAVLSLAAGPAAAQSSGWQPGPGAVADNTYDGFIDAPTGGATVPGGGAFAVAGWFVDTTAQGWAGADDVEVWLGTMDGGGRMLAKAAFAQSRPDVATALSNPFWAASGFNAGISGSAVPAGPQTLSVYVHTPGKGWWFKQVNVTGGGSGTGSATAPSAPVAGAAPQLTIISPEAGADVSTRSDFTIQGTTTDPGFGASGIDRVDIYINGERNSQYATQLGTPTPESDGSWTLTFKPTRFPSTHSNIYVYAHSRNTGLETLVSRDFNIVDK
jgi:Bacterial Ig domain